MAAESNQQDFLYVPLQSTEQGKGAVRLDSRKLPDANDVLGAAARVEPVERGS